MKNQPNNQITTAVLTPDQVREILDDEATCECCKAELMGQGERLFGLEVEDRPDLTELKQRLLKWGGSRFQRNDFLSDQLSRKLVKQMLKDGRRFSGRSVNIVPMEPEYCHQNSLLLAFLGKAQWWTGVALSDDGVWRLHSWGIQDNRVWETTEQREEYFGVRVPTSYWAEFCAEQHLQFMQGCEDFAKFMALSPK